MRVIALVENENHVCCRYRLRAFAPYLEAAGHTIEYRSLPKQWWSRFWFLAHLREECVLLQRRLLSAWETAFLRKGSNLLLYDLDDAVFLKDSYKRRWWHSARRSRRFARIVRSVDVAVAGNAFLASNMQHQRPEVRVEVIPTCVNLREYTPVERQPSARTQLVWIGSSSTLRGLTKNRALFETLGRRVPNLELKLICDSFATFDPLPTVPCPWSQDRETRDIADSDIGISWIPDDPWSRGKCGLKVLQYMAAGLPVVTNPVGVHTEMIEQGVTGFLVSTEHEWVEAIGLLSRDARLRRGMGHAARERVRRLYDVEVGARKWIALLDELQPKLRRAG